MKISLGKGIYKQQENTHNTSFDATRYSANLNKLTKYPGPLKQRHRNEEERGKNERIFFEEVECGVRIVTLEHPRVLREFFFPTLADNYSTNGSRRECGMRTDPRTCTDAKSIDTRVIQSSRLPLDI